MYCVNCGNKVDENAKFCSNCGIRVSEQKNALLTKQLRCRNCNGAMIVDEEQPVMSCPYCGSRELILENDKVTIQRIKSKAHKEIEFAKQRTYKDVELGKEEYKNKKDKLESIQFIALLIAIVLMMWMGYSFL